VVCGPFGSDGFLGYCLGGCDSEARFPTRLRAKSESEMPLLLDRAAGDAIAGVARGVGHEIVGLGMDDQRRSAVVEERIGAVPEGDAVGEESRPGVAVLAHREIHQIAEVGMGILCVVDAVMSARRVEVAAG